MLSRAAPVISLNPERKHMFTSLLPKLVSEDGFAMKPSLAFVSSMAYRIFFTRQPTLRIFRIDQTKCQAAKTAVKGTGKWVSTNDIITSSFLKVRFFGTS